jgi:hypothetical protein
MALPDAHVQLEMRGVNHWFGVRKVLFDVNLRLRRGQFSPSSAPVAVKNHAAPAPSSAPTSPPGRDPP